MKITLLILLLFSTCTIAAVANDINAIETRAKRTASLIVAAGWREMPPNPKPASSLYFMRKRIMEKEKKQGPDAVKADWIRYYQFLKAVQIPKHS